MMRGEPREQYERTYILLPPGAGAEWARAVLEATWAEKRYTMGGSADDAGVGDLDVRRVVAINPGGWGGEDALRAWYADWYPGVELAFVYADSPEQLLRILQLPDPAPSPPLLAGLHDETGGWWMQAHGMRGVCLVHRQVQSTPVDLDFRYLQQKGVTVIARLNWGYVGTGTMPHPTRLESHLTALADTMNGAQGVDYFHPWNEPNNASEWPDGYELTAGYVLDAYNELCGMVGSGVRIGPPPLDPFYGPGSDNGEWWRYILGRIERADALFLHTGKTQTNDPALVWSDAKFIDWPLRWQYLNARATETYLEMVPDRWRGLPVFLTECNPQHLERVGGALGWNPDNATWVCELARYARSVGVTGAVFYRYELAGDQAAFGLVDKPILLEAIRGL